MLHHCGAKITRNGIDYVANHSSLQDARDCSLINLSMRDSGKSGEEAALALHPELGRMTEVPHSHFEPTELRK